MHFTSIAHGQPAGIELSTFERIGRGEADGCETQLAGLEADLLAQRHSKDWGRWIAPQSMGLFEEFGDVVENHLVEIVEGDEDHDEEHDAQAYLLAYFALTQ